MDSQADRRYNITITSPAHKMTSFNENSKYNIDNPINVHRRDKKNTTCDEPSDIHNEVHQPVKNMELCTILENKMVFDAERSGETIFDEDSSNGNNKKYSDSKLSSEHTPILTVVDSECTHFIKDSQRNDNDEVLNIYGNQAYEEHSTDVALNVVDRNRSRIKHSYSLDLIRAPKDNIKRKLSVETKYETVIRTKAFVDNIIEL